jgi:hydroxymethylglutaryl-CoA lyase
MGGCPFAQDALVGNIPTEVLLATLKELGAELPEIEPLDRLIASSGEIARRYGLALQ